MIGALLSYRLNSLKQKIANMNWKEIQKVDKYIRETEDYLLNHTPWDGIRDCNFYQEVEYRMKKEEKR